MSEETELLRLILREPETGLEEGMRRYAPFVKAAAGRVLPGAPQEVERPAGALACSPQWNDTTLAAKKLLPMSKFAQLTFAKGVLHGGDLLVVCEDAFTYELCNETSVKQALAQAAQAVLHRTYRVKVLEESKVSALSTKANPVDDIIRRAAELDIACNIDD